MNPTDLDRKKAWKIRNVRPLLPKASEVGNFPLESHDGILRENSRPPKKGFSNLFESSRSREISFLWITALVINL